MGAGFVVHAQCPVGAGASPEAVPSASQPFEVKEYSQPRSHFANPLAPYTARNVAPPNLANTARIDQLMRDGKLYISMNDAVALALENNLDIAIARYNLNIADTDIWRAKAGASILGVNSGVVQNTPGGGVGGLGSQVGSGQGGTSVAAGWRRHRYRRPGRINPRQRSAHHQLRSHPHGHAAGRSPQDRLLQPFLRIQSEHNDRQFRLQPGIPVGHKYGGRLQQQPDYFQQPVH